VALFTAWPVLLSIYQSFFRQRMNIARFREPTFIGLGNYVDLFTDPYFIKVISNTLYYIIGTVPISIMLGFLFALLVNRKVRGIGFSAWRFFIRWCCLWSARPPSGCFSSPPITACSTLRCVS